MPPNNVPSAAGALALHVLLFREPGQPPGDDPTTDLGNFGFEVVLVHDASGLDSYVRIRWPDIVIFDVPRPAENHLDAVSRLRHAMKEVGIVLLAGQGNMSDQVDGLSAGADAYIHKPFKPEFIAASLFSLSRRLRPSQVTSLRRWRLDADGWCLSSPAGRMVDLTRSEARLLSRLLERRNQAISRNELIEALSGNVYDFDPHRLDSLVHRLRKKVHRSTGETLPLNTVYGEGYVFLLI